MQVALPRTTRYSESEHSELVRTVWGARKSSPFAESIAKSSR